MQKLPDDITAAALAFWSYDEKHVVDKINEAFEGTLHPHFIKNDDGSHFFGLISDPVMQTAWIVSRGTDGDNWLGNLRSWITDVKLFTGPDGMHNGFQRLANTVFNRFKSVLPQYKHIICIGHSQGAGVSQIVAKLAYENLSSHKTVRFITFATPPAGNKTFADTMAPYLKSGRMHGLRYTMPGDPIASKSLRDQKSLLLNGVDTGDEIVLPDFIQYDIGPAEFAMHSCRVYAAGLMMHHALNGDISDDQYEFLGKIFDWCVN